MLSDDTATGEAGAYDFYIQNDALYWVEIDASNFAPAVGGLPGNVLENYTYTGDLGNDPDYSGPDPRPVLIGSTIVDYDHADFPFTLPASVDVEKMLVGDNPFSIGVPVDFTIRITNTGLVTITELPLTDSYDSVFLRYDSATIAPDTAPPASPEGQLVWDNVAPANGLAPGGAVSIDVTFTTLADTSLLTAVSPCTASGETPNVVRVTSALADVDGTGPHPSVIVTTDEDCASMEVLAPTAVNVANRSARMTDAGMELSWNTLSEVEMVGFNVLLSRNGGEPQQLNQQLIVAKRAGEAQGATYSFLDTSMQQRTTSSYLYLLEVVTTNSIAERMVLTQMIESKVYLR